MSIWQQLASPFFARSSQKNAKKNGVWGFWGCIFGVTNTCPPGGGLLLRLDWVKISKTKTQRDEWIRKRSFWGNMPRIVFAKSKGAGGSCRGAFGSAVPGQIISNKILFLSFWWKLWLWLSWTRFPMPTFLPDKPRNILIFLGAASFGSKISCAVLVSGGDREPQWATPPHPHLLTLLYTLTPNCSLIPSYTDFLSWPWPVFFCLLLLYLLFCLVSHLCCCFFKTCPGGYHPRCLFLCASSFIIRILGVLLAEEINSKVNSVYLHEEITLQQSPPMLESTVGSLTKRLGLNSGRKARLSHLTSPPPKQDPSFFFSQLSKPRYN